MTALALVVIKASVVLGAAAMAAAAMRRRSAAARHLVWTAALTGVLVLPALSLVLPRWPAFQMPAAAAPSGSHTDVRIADAPAGGAVTSRASISSAPVEPSVVVPQSAPATERPSLASIVLIVYGVGLTALICGCAFQHWRVRSIARAAVDVSDAAWTALLATCARDMHVRRTVGLLRSRAQSMPMAIGVRRPAIVMPASADLWPEERRRAVLRHELAHVARRDCLTQMIASAATALYWFNPLVWLAARQLRVERELACDDRVIEAGTPAREYADHLLEIAYALGGQRVPALAVSMARPRQLEGRMLAVLDAARTRGIPRVRTAVAIAAIAVALLLPVAAATTASDVLEPSVNPAADVDSGSDARATQPAVDDTAVRAKGVLKAAKGTLKSTRATFKDAARSLGSTVAAVVQLDQERGTGTWELVPSEKEGVVELHLKERHSNYGTTVPIEQLEGLTKAQIVGAGGPVQFRMRRDAGTFTFEGVIRNSVGAGTFTFTPDPNFGAELAKRGFARPSAAEQYRLARQDIGFAYLDELNRQGYAKPALADIVRAGDHGVNLVYLRDMGSLGYKFPALDPLIELRDHGVTPRYIRELADMGYKNMPADALRQARDHGVTAQYARGMREAGFGTLSMDQLVTARDHGVTAEFARELAGAGYTNIPIDDMIRIRDHGVSGDFVRGMRELGYSASVDDLVRARDHGVSIEYIRELTALGYTKVPLDTLTRMRDHGVTAAYVRALKDLGYERVPIADLITLRDYGMTAERIRAANAKAGTRLPLDLLRSMR